MAISGLEGLAQSLAIDTRGRKIEAIQAVKDAAELLRGRIVPELEALTQRFDPRLARAAAEALGALALSQTVAKRLGGAA